MSTRLLLIRHGETIWNHERRCQGFSDIPLSENGEAQAEALGQILRAAPLVAVYSSDLVRARRTAEIVGAHHKLPVQLDVRLRELNQGTLEGQSLQNLLSDHPDLLKKWMSEPADVTMPGGESMRSLQKRAWKTIEEIVERHPEKAVAVVAHNLCILSIICRAINLELNNFRCLRIENASISEIDFASFGPVLVRLNDTFHLTSNR